MDKTVYTTDVLIIGNGIAGLRAACSAGETGASVTVVGMGEGASPGIMAFNAPVGPDDSAEIFYQETISSGCYINDHNLAKIFARDICKEVAYLESIGIKFDRNETGGFDLLHALGASQARLVHYKSLTGITEIKLLKREAQKFGAVFHHNFMMTGLLLDEGKVCGAAGISLETGDFTSYFAGSVILATGGCGAMYPITQYPNDIIGGGYRAAYRAGAELVDMEFMQFEPCIFIYPEEIKGKPIPTTMMMEGAELRNVKGEVFVGAYDESGEKMHKDALSRVIRMEIEAGRGTENGGVYYDVSMLPRNRIVVDHSIFYEPALKAGVDLTKEPAEVAPAAQTSLGGVRINEECETSLPGLYAAGEVTGGLFGANRMGGSAGAEILVFGARAGLYAARYALENKRLVSPGEAGKLVECEKNLYDERRNKKDGVVKLNELLSAFHKVIWDDLNLIKQKDGLQKAITALEEIEAKIPLVATGETAKLVELYRFENMITSACIMATASLTRTESRGVHYRSDYPEKDDQNWLNKVVVKNIKEKMTVGITATEA
jgi:fumarate reductase (CoM/CoB) subunit A